MIWPAWVITKRELKSLFVSPIAYVVLGLFALGTGIYFLASMEQFDAVLQQAQTQAQITQNPEVLNFINLNSMLINSVTSFSFMLLMFGVPFFTMRTLSEERSNGTYELLMTSPISPADIVLGKFLAALFFLVVVLCTHAIFLGVMFGFGNPEAAPVAASYLGLFLSGSVFISIGLFASSLTRYQIVAVIIAVFTNLALLMLSLAGETAFGNLGQVLTQASINTHFEVFNRGLITVSGIVYFVTTTVLFLSITQIAVKSFARS